MSGDAAECFRRAQKWIVIGTVAYLFAFHSVLLVGEFETGIFDALFDVCVIQRRCGSVVGSSIDGEVYVSVEESLRSGRRVAGREVRRASLRRRGLEEKRCRSRGRASIVESIVGLLLGCVGSETLRPISSGQAVG